MDIVIKPMYCCFWKILVIVCILLPATTLATDNNDYILKKIAMLEQEIASLKEEVAKSSALNQHDPALSTHKENHDLPLPDSKNNKASSPVILPVNKAPQNTVIATSNEPVALSAVNIPLPWLGPDVKGLMTGSASAGFSRPQNTNGSFDILDFNPIFLFGYQDFLLLRASVDFSLDDFGNTDVGLDAMNLNLFANDYIAFGIGKFDSSLGKFVQDLSPAWINRLPNAPVGFDGDQAATQSQIGLLARGGFNLFNANPMKVNYTFFVENGPVGVVDTVDGFIDHINTDGTLDNHGNYVVGGRIGILPLPSFEIGLSAATGKIALLDLDDHTLELQRKRHYNVLGADVSYKPGNWDFRGEYIRQQVSHDDDALVPEGGMWRAWYLQTAYWIPNTKWEPVIRYGKYNGANDIEDQRQWALGVNYWFTPRIALQAAYELSEALDNAGDDQNLFLIQLVFGF